MDRRRFLLGLVAAFARVPPRGATAKVLESNTTTIVAGDGWNRNRWVGGVISFSETEARHKGAWRFNARFVDSPTFSVDLGDTAAFG